MKFDCTKSNENRPAAGQFLMDLRKQVMRSDTLLLIEHVRNEDGSTVTTVTQTPKPEAETEPGPASVEPVEKVAQAPAESTQAATKAPQGRKATR
ncbi:MAG: hypothetical protein AAGJ40_09415 [Planctomycetota bacterium]